MSTSNMPDVIHAAVLWFIQNGHLQVIPREDGSLLYQVSESGDELLRRLVENLEREAR